MCTGNSAVYPRRHRLLKNAPKLVFNCQMISWVEDLNSDSRDMNRVQSNELAVINPYTTMVAP
jgi:hypothetical protein